MLKLQAKLIEGIQQAYQIEGRYAFSEEMEKTYSQLIQIFESCPEKYGGFENERNPKDLTKDNKVAGNVYWYMPAHFFKILRVFLESEKKSFDKPEWWFQSIFSTPNVFLLDIGSGYGTVPAVIFDLICAYQKQKILNKLPVFPIRLSILQIDIAKAAIDCSNLLLDLQSQHSDGLLADIKRLPFIDKPFPEKECLTAIFESSFKDEINLKHVTMSNVLTWLTNEQYTEENARKIGETLTCLCDECCHRDMHLVLIEAKHKELKREWFLTWVIRCFFQIIDKIPYLFGYHGYAHEQILESMKTDKVDLSKVMKQHAVVSFCNPNNSMHGRMGRKEYYSNFVYGWAKANRMRSDTLNKMLTEENLMQAWAKARWDCYLNDFHNHLEVKLFEGNFESNQRFHQANLGRIAQLIAHGVVPIYHDYYEVPKPQGGRRPKTSVSFEECVISQAIMNVIGPCIEAQFDQLDVSYGNRLILDAESEYTFEWWHKRYRDRIKKIRQSVKGDSNKKIVINTDIKRFYDSIPRQELLDIISDMLSEGEDDVLQLIRQLVMGNDGADIGIPQGTAFSGFLANIYLHKKLDEQLVGDERVLYYTRYVDDILVVCENKDVAQDILEKIQRTIAPLELSPFESQCGKTRLMSPDEFLEETKAQPELTKLESEVRSLINALYFIPVRHRLSFIRNPHEFTEMYSRCLQAIGISLPSTLLRRKLRMPGRKWLNNRLSANRIRLPSLPAHIDEDVDNWAEDFKLRNPLWMNKRKSVGLKLFSLLKKAEPYVLDGDETTIEWHRYEKRARFAIYRLGIVLAPEAVELISHFLGDEMTALLSLHTLSKYPQAREIISQYYQSVELPFLAGQALTALAESSGPISTELYLEALNVEHWMVRYYATEGLLKSNLQNLDYKTVEAVKHKLGTEKHPIVKANLLVLGALILGDDIRDELELSAFKSDTHPGIRLACQAMTYYQRTNPISLPEVEPPYIKGLKYPVLPPEKGAYDEYAVY